MIRIRKLLGLALNRRSITATEVAVVRGRCRVVRAAELPLSAEAGLHDPARLGKALKDMLRAGHFSAWRCVIGLDATCLVAKDKRFPAAAASSMCDILRLAAEQDFATDSQNLLVDYVPVSSTAAVLIAAPRSVTVPLLSAADAAGLSVLGVTSSALALAQVTSRAAQTDRLVVSLTSGGADVAVQSSGETRLLRGLVSAGGAAPQALADLEGELRRMLGSGLVHSDRAELVVWNSSGLEDAAVEVLGKRLGAAVHICRLPADLDELDGADVSAGDMPSAAALPTAYLKGLAVDFINSRLAPPRRRRFGRWVTWGGIAAGLAILLGALFIYDWRSDVSDIADMKSRLSEMAPLLKQSKDVIAKTTFARGWYDKRPKFMDCLREVTLAFPEEGKIWATNLSVHEDMRVVLSGKASGESAVLDVRDRLKMNPHFTEIKLLYLRQAGGTSHEVAFAISLALPGAM